MQTWSLAVEEQFYFMLPISLVLIAWHRKVAWLPPLITVGIVVSALYRARFGPTTNIVSVMDGLFVGLWVAHLQMNKPEALEPFRRRANLMLIGGLLIVYGPFALPEHSVARNVFGDTGAAIGFGCILVAALGRNALTRLLDSRIAFWMALASYSVYLSHDRTLFHVARLSDGLHLSGSTKLLFIELAGMAAAYLVGAVLYVLVEKPFLTLRDWLTPRTSNVSDGTRIGAAHHAF